MTLCNSRRSTLRSMDKFFASFANATARAAGSPLAFLLCVALVVAWAVSGPFFHFSENWQLTINTGPGNAGWRGWFFRWRVDRT